MTAVDELRARLRGVIAPTVTPFAEDGELWFPGVRRVIDFLVEADVTAIIPGDLIGECLSLTLDERRALIAESVQAVGGRMAVVGNAADASLQNAIDLGRFSRKADVDLIKLGLPYPYTPAAATMLDMLRRIDDAVDMPFLVESSDALTIPLEVIASLCERPNFVGVEEWGSDIGRMDRLFSEFSRRLVVLPSGEAALLFLCLRGAPGLIAAEANFAPRFMSEFLGASQRRDLDRALALFGRRRRYRDLFREGLARGVPLFTPYAKAAMAILGLPVGPPRPPLAPLTEGETARLREVLRQEFDLLVGGA
ncbi:MAG: dihydrodipicolinate synthase family protein [Candidatus Rokubacteria bacterium]|nr:dihydrodipicolinate synthase family protein [Candidatus Rokubacteria bacterium]